MSTVYRPQCPFLKHGFDNFILVVRIEMGTSYAIVVLCTLLQAGKGIDLLCSTSVLIGVLCNAISPRTVIGITITVGHCVLQ